MGSPLMYGGFFAAVLVMVLIDIFALNRAGQHKVSVREALGWSAIWCSPMRPGVGLWENPMTSFLSLQ